MQRAVFLERDGVLNYDQGYLSDPQQIKILPKVLEGLQKMKNLGLKTIVISNQSGVARKYFDIKTMRAVDAQLRKIINKSKILLDDSFYCPHHPDFDKNCSCRKPKTRLVKKAVKKHKIDISKSFFIGDKIEDILCGENAGCKTILVPKNLKRLAKVNTSIKPNFVAKDLLGAAYWIEETCK